MSPISLMMRPFRLVTQGAVDLLFPQRCGLCRGLPECGGDALCGYCAAAVAKLRRRPGCPTCGSSVARYEVSRGLCRLCRERPWPILGTVRVGPYADELGALVRVYKYHGREELGSLLGGWLVETVTNAPWLDRVEAVVSIPTHWRHRLSRPFHAADALAAIVATRIGLPHVPVLRRVRAGRHQIELRGYTARVENVRGAFALQRGVVLHDARFLLIDDVKTTGATIRECTNVLRRGGAAEVYAAALVVVGGDQPTGQRISST